MIVNPKGLFRPVWSPVIVALGVTLPFAAALKMTIVSS